MSVIGYARVSTKDQNIEMQTEALRAAGAERIFEDVGISGSKASRPGLDHLLDHLREGDEIIVWKLDRIARNTKHLLELVEQLREKGVSFRSLTEGISTQGAMGRAMLTIMGALAELERDQLIERTQAGLAAARGRGRIGGRPRLDQKTIEQARNLKAAGWEVSDIAETLHVGQSTLYRYLQEAQNA